jgi:PTH1 family peptidyl-tRNA hydrolase
MRLSWHHAAARPGETGDPAMLIVGLGNPGRRYERTRHNIGFKVVERLAADHGSPRWREERQALVARIMVDERDVLLAKPQTFMNLSGQAVRALAARYHLPPASILVISDDLDLPFARLRLRAGGSPGGHNGLRSIIAELGTQDFLRLRIGIGRPAEGDPIEYVLSPFEPAEARDLDYICRVAADEALYVVRHGIRAAMNQFNGRADAREPVPAGEERRG